MSPYRDPLWPNASARTWPARRPSTMRLGAAGLAALLLISVFGLTGCGGSDVAQTLACQIAESELGPFSAGSVLGESMTDDEARARMANESISSWIAVSASGPWDDAWVVATDRLGPGIHTGLTWLDVEGELSGLFASGDSYHFDDLRVSRSFQGKIEHSSSPIFLPVGDEVGPVNYGAVCTITAIEVGDETSDVLTDVSDAVPTEI